MKKINKFKFGYSNKIFKK